MNKFEALEIVLHPMRGGNLKHYDEAVNIVESQLKLCKLYKELAEIRLELFKVCAMNKKNQPPHYPPLKRLYEILDTIEELEK